VGQYWLLHIPALVQIIKSTGNYTCKLTYGWTLIFPSPCIIINALQCANYDYTNFFFYYPWIHVARHITVSSVYTIFRGTYLFLLPWLFLSIFTTMYVSVSHDGLKSVTCTSLSQFSLNTFTYIFGILWHWRYTITVPQDIKWQTTPNCHVAPQHKESSTPGHADYTYWTTVLRYPDFKCFIGLWFYHLSVLTEYISKSV
jgi:hypothetical protein